MLYIVYSGIYKKKIMNPGRMTYDHMYEPIYGCIFEVFGIYL